MRVKDSIRPAGRRRRLPSLFTSTCLFSLVLSVVMSFFTAFASEGQAENDPESRSPSEDHVDVPLWIDETNAGLITIIPADDESMIRIKGSEFFQAILSVATPKLQMEIWNAVSDGFLSLNQLRDLGLDAKLEPVNLEIIVKIPPEQKKTEDLSLRAGRSSLQANKEVPQANSSGILNAYASRAIRHDHNASHANPLRADFNSALNTHGLVWEAEGTYTEFAPSPWRRGDLRLVYDLRDNSIRIMAGDLSYPVSGYSSFVPMGGISATREFTLNPDLISYPTTLHELQLKHPSRVDVVVNGTIVRTLRLPPGRFNIREIPLAHRVNKIDLIITDPFGRTETVSFPFIAATELLHKGLHQFSYNLGFPSKPAGGHYEYDEDRPTFSVSHRVGLTDRFTLGGFLQGERTHQVTGLEGIAVHPLGLFQIELALSSRPGHKPNGAGRLSYRAFRDLNSKSILFDWGLQFETLDRHFGQFGSQSTGQRFRNTLNLFANLRLAPEWNATVGGFQHWPHSGSPQAHGAYLQLTTNLNSSLQAMLELSTTDDPAIEQQDQRALITLRWRDSSTPLASTLSYDSRANMKRAEVTYNQGRGHLDSSFLDDNTTRTANFNARTYTERTQLGYSLTANQVKSDVQHTNSSSLLQFGTALLMANGAFTLSRPVSDSFAIIGDSGQSWQHGLLVNPDAGPVAAKVDRWGPAVLPDLRSYRRRHLYIDASAVQTGLGLKKSRFLLRPGYRSGYHLPLELHSVVIAQGRIVDSQNRGVALQGGEFKRVPTKEQAESAAVAENDANDSIDAPIEFFTDREGLFETEGLNPGIYEIQLYSDEYKAIRIEIRAGAQGYVDLGEITLKKKKE